MANQEFSQGRPGIMNNDIRSILERLSVIENRVTPVAVDHGLNAQQKSVHQMPALFKPKSISVLTNKTDPEHPAHNVLVGDSVAPALQLDGRTVNVKSIQIDGVDVRDRPDFSDAYISYAEFEDGTALTDTELDTLTDNNADLVNELAHESLYEGIAKEEKLLDKVKRSFADYLDSVENKFKDKTILDKPKDDHSLGKKDKHEKDLVAPQVTITAETSPVKTVELDENTMLEIHGDQGTGFSIKHGGKTLKTKFKNLEQAEMAVEMFMSRRKNKDNPTADFLDEA